MDPGPSSLSTVAAPARGAGTAALFAFSATLFLSAALLFAIQPVVGKMVLPLLGGTPQVWNTCMVFFQAMLFAGYLHAHYSGVVLGRRRQAVGHLLLALLAWLALPFGLSDNIPAVDPDQPISGLLQMLLVSVGLPVFVISSTAPLVQRWFAETRDPAAGDPYFLYAASNLGSLTALLGYPLLVEPVIETGQQAMLLSGAYALLTGALAICAWLAFRGSGMWDVAHSVPGSGIDGGLGTTGAAHPAAVSWRERGHWLVLALVPSSLLLGVTTHITTDIAAVPLFWVLPLALYLLSFVIVFARHPLVSRDIALRWQALLVSLLVAMMLLPAVSQIWPMLIVHLLAFFATALVCHGELVRTRPPAVHLTEFYLWMSAGGLLGGVFNALLAPALFTWPIEYPLMLALACVLRPADSPARTWLRSDLLLPLALAGLVLVVAWGIAWLDSPTARFSTRAALVVVTACALLAFSARHLRYGLGVGAVLLAMGAWSQVDRSRDDTRTDLIARSFFGVYQVRHNARSDMNVLVHGTTVHGAQLRQAAVSREPLLYYARSGSFGGMFDALAGRLARVAVVGLGAGGLSCYGQPGSEWAFYEIDPLVERIARDPRHFSFLRDCPPAVRVVIGDARLSLRRAPPAHYDLLVVDAFSSDAIPTHLLTREAMAGYLDKLAPDGVLVIHISNRFMDLEPVVAALARDAGLTGRSSINSPSAQRADIPATYSHLVVLARHEADLRTLATSPDWRRLAEASARVWTDSYVNVLAALRWTRPPARDVSHAPDSGG